MKEIIKDLNQIKVNLQFAVDFRDGLVVISEIKKVDALILRLSKILNEGIQVNDKSVCPKCGSSNYINTYLIEECKDCCWIRAK
jgi:hypothetical protein